MNNSAIVYATKTKHSQKLAEAIGQRLQIAALNIKQNPALGDLDLLFIVGGIYASKSMPELLEYVDRLDRRRIRKVALITSCASNRQKQDSVRSILNNKGIDVVDEFVCQGNFLLLGKGHPNMEDIENAVNFAVKVSKMHIEK